MVKIKKIKEKRGIMFVEYIFLYKYFLFCLFVCVLLFSISFFLIYQVNDIEKISSYECDLVLLVILELNLKLGFI